MLKGLQKNDGRGRETSTPIRPVKLILNGDYIGSVLDYINAATDDIAICAYAWRWYMNEPDLYMQKFNVAILRAVGRGVKVRVICDNEMTYALLKKAGVNVKYVRGNRVMHIKAICIDYKVLVLGSHNLTKNATQNNYEASVIITEFEPIEQFMRYFNGIWGQLHES